MGQVLKNAEQLNSKYCAHKIRFITDAFIFVLNLS